MNIALYIFIFIIGIILGEFYEILIYRLPKKRRIIHATSHCPNCDRDLGFKETIPLLSYIFLKGRCKHCNERIRGKYFFSELLTGLLYVLVAFLMGVTVQNLTVELFLNWVFTMLYLSFIIIIAGIDFENRKIHRNVLIYGILISLAYIVYQSVLLNANIYKYVIYLIFFVLVLLLDTVTLKKHAVNSYINGVILTGLIMAIFSGEFGILYTIIITAVAVALNIILRRIKNMKNKNRREEKRYSKEIDYAFYLSIANIITMIVVLVYDKFFA